MLKPPDALGASSEASPRSNGAHAGISRQIGHQIGVEFSDALDGHRAIGLG